LVLLAALITSGCDPGIMFIPQDWEKVGPYRFGKSFGPIEIEMNRAGGLIGESWFDPHFSARNRGNEVISFQKIYLVAGDERYDSITRNKAELTLKPHEVHELSTQWEFSNGKYLSQVFRKPPAEIHIEALVGKEPTTIVIILTDITH